MNLLTPYVALAFTIVALSLIWARFYFFTIDSKHSKRSSWLYDPVVAVHIAQTYYSLVTRDESGLVPDILGILLYFFGLLLFFWSIKTAKKLNFAFGENLGKIVTSGPFSVIRHPFYMSYMFFWLSYALIFDSIVLWITLIYLVAFYISSAMSEEKAILRSTHSTEYQNYCRDVGMFLPRIKLWKKLDLKQ